MPSLAEILAAKKAAAQAGATDVVAKPAISTPAPVTVVAEPVKQEPAVLPGKPLSFAEKLALKKKQEQLAATTAPAAAPTTQQKPASGATTVPVTTGSTTASTTSGNKESGDDFVDAMHDTGTAVAKTAGPLDHLTARIAQAHVALPAVDPVSRETRIKQIADSIPEGTESAVADAYIDIKLRIDDLVALSGEDLVSAMSELKKALMKNPSAVSLMLDPDIGQMVIALRRITNVAATEAAKPGKTGPKATKSVQLTAEAMELAFAEL